MKKSKKIIIFAGVAVVVIALSAGAAIWLSQLNSSNDNGQQPEESMEEDPGVIKGQEADKLAVEGNLEGGVELLDDAIESSGDSYEIYVLYSEKASLLLNNGKVDEAFAAAMKAYEAQQNSNSAGLVAQVAEQKGDTATAIDYYKKAADLIDPEASPLANQEKQYYQQKASELGGGQ